MRKKIIKIGALMLAVGAISAGIFGTTASAASSNNCVNYETYAQHSNKHKVCYNYENRKCNNNDSHNRRKHCRN